MRRMHDPVRNPRKHAGESVHKRTPCTLRTKRQWVGGEQNSVVGSWCVPCDTVRHYAPEVGSTARDPQRRCPVNFDGDSSSQRLHAHDCNDTGWSVTWCTTWHGQRIRQYTHDTHKVYTCSSAEHASLKQSWWFTRGGCIA